jgi:RNA polymerase sigma-70 factor (ECF subfamily)
MITPNEEQLQLLCEQGDFEEATKQAIRTFGPEIFGWLCSITKQRSISEDVCQQFCIELWRGLPSFRWEGSLRVWSYRVAWRELIRAQQSQKRRKEEHLPTSQFLLLKQEVSSIHENINAKQVKSRLVELRQELPEELQSLLVLRIEREISFAEIAGILEMTEESARQKFKRAKDKLKEMAQKEGLIPK